MNSGFDGTFEYSRNLGANEVIYECVDDTCLPIILADPEQIEHVSHRTSHRSRREGDDDFLNMMSVGLSSVMQSVDPENHCLKICDFKDCQSKSFWPITKGKYIFQMGK